MLRASAWCPVGKYSSEHKRMKVTAIFTVILLVSMNFTSAQGTTIKHSIDNRSREIDPFWYVGRGVRPIGRFGKRQMNSNGHLRAEVNKLDLLLKSLRDHEGWSLGKTLLGEESDWLP
ncbi:prolactin releasing hormone 2 [Lepisosteus oculatus]|uniref:Prolactin releasing hormone 2 n=1 Tax=Lepisosteus oculatus TaxID=7918 RepID=W5N0Q3_LEPOC